MSGYKKYLCPNVLCRAHNCFKHCNHCGKDIKWLDYLGNPHYETNKKGNKVRLPYENDDTVHKCMMKGTKDKSFYDVKSIDQYVLDEYRKIFRLGNSPVFKCTFCGTRGDLPVMKTHHTDDRFDCNQKLMKKFFDEKPKTYIDVNSHTMDEY